MNFDVDKFRASLTPEFQRLFDITVQSVTDPSLRIVQQFCDDVEAFEQIGVNGLRLDHTRQFASILLLYMGVFFQCAYNTRIALERLFELLGEGEVPAFPAELRSDADFSELDAKISDLLVPKSELVVGSEAHKEDQVTEMQLYALLGSDRPFPG